MSQRMYWACTSTAAGGEGARVARPHAAQDVLEHALEVRVRLPVGIVPAHLVHGAGLADGDLHVFFEALLVLDPTDQVLAEVGVLAGLEDAPGVAACGDEGPRGTARRLDHLGLLGERMLLVHHRVVEARAVVGAHELPRHVRLVVVNVGPRHDARRLDLVLRDGVHRELERLEVLLEEGGGQRGLAVLVPRAPAVVPQDVLHVAVAVVRAVEGLAEPPEVLGRVLRLLGHLHHVGIVDLGQLDPLGVEQILADEETARPRLAGHREVLAAEDYVALGMGSSPPRVPAMSLDSAVMSRRAGL